MSKLFNASGRMRTATERLTRDKGVLEGWIELMMVVEEREGCGE